MARAVVTVAVDIRTLGLGEIEPHIPLLIENGFTPDVDRGTWLGAFKGAELAGFLRVFESGGAFMVEDVWVFPEHRSRGLASTLLTQARDGRDHLWLICDDDMVGFYEARGYVLMPKAAFAEPLATLYAGKKEWPEAPDHNHNALRWSRA